jgi:hypothetical protein
VSESESSSAPATGSLWPTFGFSCLPSQTPSIINVFLLLADKFNLVSFPGRRIVTAAPPLRIAAPNRSCLVTRSNSLDWLDREMLGKAMMMRQELFQLGLPQLPVSFITVEKDLWRRGSCFGPEDPTWNKIQLDHPQNALLISLICNSADGNLVRLPSHIPS